MTKDLPRSFGRYQLIRLLGEGGMAEVYLANVRVAEGLIKWVVIKKIRQDFVNQSEFTRMFVDEAKIALSLNHANIVHVFDFGQIESTFYLAMEMIEGIDLMALIHAVRARGETIAPVFAAYIGHQMASGMAYVHRKTDDHGNPLGIVHRDVTPHNVMISFDGQVKLLDFGIARTNQDLNKNVATRADEETIKGKVAYMSPEQALGRPIDQRSDIYSMGVVLHELLTGNLLFRERDRMKAFERVRNESIESLSTCAPHVPAELAKIIDQALARELNSRLPTAREFQARLARFLHGADPVVDDEVLSRFVLENRTPEPLTVSPNHTEPEIYTRELLDSQPGHRSIEPNRQSLRVVLLHAYFQQNPSPTPSSQDHARHPPSSPNNDRFLDFVRDLAFKREAHVIRLDSKGALLAFGTVPTALDDAERALRSALAMWEIVGETAPDHQLGVVLVATQVKVQHRNNGAEIVTLPRGLSNHLENVARKTLDDKILVSRELVRGLSQYWRFGAARYIEISTSNESIQLPWISDLQEIAPFLGPLSEGERKKYSYPGGRLPLVGRDLELKTLRDTFTNVIRSGSTRSCFVFGEAGMGKQALIERFVSSLPSGACAVLRGAGLWSDRHQPFGVLLETLRRFLKIEVHTSKAALIAKLEEIGLQQIDSLAEAMAGALGLEGISDQPLEPLERHHRINRLIRRVMQALARRRPVLLVMENLHFVDEQSFAVLKEWTRMARPLPILGVFSSRSGPRAEHMLLNPLMVYVHLCELDPKSRREMILRRFEDPAKAEPLAEAILAITGGNPLFIEETLTSLLRQGVVGWNAQARYLRAIDPQAEIELSPTIEATLKDRLDELEPSQREIVQAAAILGRRFRASELVSFLPQDTNADIAKLIEENFIERYELPGPNNSELFQFKTVSLHEVCKSSASPLLAQQFHAQAALIKSKREDYVAGRDDGPIADHFYHAGRFDKCINPAMRAAQDAHDVAGNVEAYYYLTLAIKALDTNDPRRFIALQRRELILRAWGRRRAQGADIRQLLNFAEISEDREQQVIATTLLMRFYFECGRYQRAANLIDALEKEIAQLPHQSDFLAELAELKSDLEFAQRNFIVAEKIARDGLVHCQDYQDDQNHQNDRNQKDDPHQKDRPESSRQRCRLLSCIGRAQLSRHEYESAELTFKTVLDLARAQGNRRIEAEALNDLGTTAGFTTRYQAAINNFRESLAIDRRLGDRFSTGTKLANLGITYTMIGLYARAERYLRKALELHEAIGHPGLLNDVIINLGEAVLGQGEQQSAKKLFAKARDAAAERSDHRSELRAKVRLVSLVVETTEHVDLLRQAQTECEALQEPADSMHLPSTSARIMHVLARIAVKCGDLNTAIQHEQAACALIHEGALPLEGVLSLHHLGSLLRQTGDQLGAEPYLREAARIVRARLEELQDPELREGYLQHASVKQILADDPEGGYASSP